jgi:phospholipase/lecithinase/hemolysin
MNLNRKSLCAAILAGTCLSAPAHAGNFYVFGDSLVDNGNTPKLTGIDYPPPPYYENRFSNGPVWAEYFPGLTGLGSMAPTTAMWWRMGAFRPMPISLAPMPRFISRISI